MTSSPAESTSTRAHLWLSNHALPTWFERGFDRRRGFFHEALNSDLTPVLGPVRTLVQARQMYSFRVALDLDLGPMEVAGRAITAGARFLIDRCRNPDGSFAHAVDPERGITRATPELYTQAFALFGLAQAFALAPMPEYRDRALELFGYMRAHRATDFGGFTELGPNDEPLHRSNPIMHLFEAAVFWMEIDPTESRWSDLADQLADLAVNKLVDAETGLIAEDFESDWRPTRESGRFFWEPGHQFEWSWLLGRHQGLSGRDHTAVRTKLYELATTHGVRDGRAIDQAWSDLTHRARSARFWPQAERAKAAVQRGDFTAAEEALGALSSYLDVPRPGLWCDTIDAAGTRDARPSKASSLYHIIGAFAEYLNAAHQAASTLSPVREDS